MFCYHQKGITAHADCDFSIDRPDQDDKELVRVDKEQLRRGDKELREDRDRDNNVSDHDVKCSPQKRKYTHSVDDIVTDPYYKGAVPLFFFFCLFWTCLGGSPLLGSPCIYLS